MTVATSHATTRTRSEPAASSAETGLDDVFDLPRQAIFDPDGRGLDLRYSYYENRHTFILNVLDDLPNSPSLVRIRPAQILCNADLPGRCITYKEGKVLYFDDDHLSIEGADLVLRQLTKYLASPAAPS